MSRHATVQVLCRRDERNTHWCEMCESLVKLVRECDYP